MKFSLTIILTGILLGFFLSCRLNSNKEEYKIPKHSIFVACKIDIQEYHENYVEKYDSIIICTKDKVIIVTGEFIFRNNLIYLAPIIVDGGSGFHYSIIKNDSLKLNENSIFYYKVFLKTDV